MDETIAAICPVTCAAIGVFAPACAPSYVANAGTGNTCEAGEPITDVAECEAAAAFLATSSLPGYAYRSDNAPPNGEISIDYAPNGCMVGVDGKMGPLMPIGSKSVTLHSIVDHESKLRPFARQCRSLSLRALLAEAVPP